MVFCKIDGIPYNPTTFTYDFKKIVKEAGIERNIRFHDLRYTVATRLMENNVGFKAVQEILGHSTVNVTLNVYTHISNDIKKQAVEKLNMNTK